MTLPRLVTGLAVAAVLGCGSGESAVVAPQRPAQPRPATSEPAPVPLVVLVVVDQLPSWAFASYLPQLDGGIARMVEEGIYYPEAEYPFAASFTAPGHAAIATGAPPAVTGILANRWYDRALGRQVTSVEDSAHPPLAILGDPAAQTDPGTGRSPARLRVDTVADRMRAAHGERSRIVTVGFKDRGAVLLAGRSANVAVFYDSRQQAMTTSSFYAERVPDWLANLARAHPLSERIADYVWEAGDPELLARATGLPDDSPGESDTMDIGLTFPHRLSGSSSPQSSIAITPLANDAVIETAMAAVEGEKLGADDVPDFLALSFSAHDYIAHVLGSESWEALDEFMRLDDDLGRLLEFLDQRVGRGRYAVIFTSDHGGTRTVELTRTRGRPAHYVQPTEVEKVAEAAARQVGGEGDWIVAARHPTIYFSERLQSVEPGVRDAIIDAVVRAVATIDGVAYVRRTDRFAAGCAEEAQISALMCRSVVPGASGEIYYGPAVDSVVMDPPFEASSHGSANPDDRMVPLVLVIPEVASTAGNGRPSMLRVAPTLGVLAGVPPWPTAPEPPLL